MNARSARRGQLMPKTDIVLSKAKEANIKITGQASRRSATKILDVNFEKLGIGGLDRQFDDIFRRAFASRIYPPAAMKKLGIQNTPLEAHITLSQPPNVRILVREPLFRVHEQQGHLSPL